MAFPPPQDNTARQSTMRQTERDKSPDATMVVGTMGATEKTDVFSYGVMVLEVASGRRPIEKDAPAVGNGKVGISINLVEWVWSLHQEGKLLTPADPRLEGKFEEGEMRKELLVGLACSHPDSMARPTMRGVVQMLLGEAEVPIVLRAKSSTSYNSEFECNSGMITISTSSSENNFNGKDSLMEV
ncbi:L-type lectin-domain containing receptor kinase VIII.1 [Glycine soja]